jgi:hypothetical protein
LEEKIMADATDFTANGPTAVAFRTGGDGTGIDNGVIAQGKIVGVTGIGLADPGTVPQPIGVVGKGQIGVMGLGRQPEGTTPDSSVGVFGQGSVGVRGSTDGAESVGVDGGSKNGIGVRGASTNNDGIVGISDADRKSGVFGDNRNEKENGSGVSGRTNSPRGSGVFGFSDAGGLGVRGFSNTNDGIRGESKGVRKSGVFGDNPLDEGETFGVSGGATSAQGAGINGFSDRGYGGQFRGGRAPLRLLPATVAGPPTGAHQRGELYVDAKGDLFFCKDDGTPGKWFRVQLTPA